MNYGYACATNTSEADERLDVAIQQRSIGAYIQEHLRTDDTDLLVENAAGARGPFLERPVARRLVARAGNGDVIVVCSFDVFWNTPDAVRTIEVFRGMSLKLHVIGIGDVTDGRFLTMAKQLADLERDRARQRTLRGHARNRSAGKHVSGRVAFGFALQDGYLKEVLQEQEAIGHMKSLRASGTSFRAIQTDLKERFGFSLSPWGIQRIVEDKRKIAVDLIHQRSIGAVVQPAQAQSPSAKPAARAANAAREPYKSICGKTEVGGGDGAKPEDDASVTAPPYVAPSESTAITRRLPRKQFNDADGSQATNASPSEPITSARPVTRKEFRRIIVPDDDAEKSKQGN